MSLVGNLEDLGLGEILQIVSLSRKTGILSLHSRGRDSSIIFRQGQVVRATSSTFVQNLGEVLTQKGVIDLSTLRKALALQQEQGFRDRLGVLLIKNFGVSQEVIEELVREQIENVVFTLFTWQDGSFEFVVQEHIETVDGTRLDPLQFMLDQGLNPQFLAMEGTRILDEQRHAEGDKPDSDVDSEHHDFDFDFDLADKPASSDTEVHHPPQPKKPLVIVDDDVPTLHAISEGMRQQGYEVHDLTRSEDTLIKIDTLCRGGNDPTVLIDLIMPKMDGTGVLGGLELLEMLHHNFKHLKIIVMTDYRHSEAESKVHDMEFAFIMKPRRAELTDAEVIQSFFTSLGREICRDDESETERASLSVDSFNLGDELRVELGDNEDSLPATEAAGGGLSLLRGVLEELNNPELQGGVLLLSLRFASEFLNRAVVFTVSDAVVSGAGQFGIEGGVVSGDDKVRALHFPMGAPSMFCESVTSGRAHTFVPDPSPIDIHIFDQFGGGMPQEAFIGPFKSRSGVIGFLYGDNLPENKPIGDVESLAIFLAQAGIAMEKNMLEKQLLERSER